MMPAWLGLAKALRPVAISYKTAPKAKMSLRVSGRLAFQLLRRHIADRPKDDAFLGQVRGLGLTIGREGSRGRTTSCQAEVEQFGTCSSQHDIPGLEVAMADGLTVRLRKAISNLRCRSEHLINRERTSGESRRKSLPLDVLHHHEAGLVLGADVEDRANVWMHERGEQLRLASEPQPPGGIVGK